jgi:deoxycytidine triphosphate deaminase
MFIPDHEIERLCGDGFPRTWSSSGGPEVGIEREIAEPGPLIAPFDRQFLGPMSYDIAIDRTFASPVPVTAYATRDGHRVRRLPATEELDGCAKGMLSESECIEIVLEPGQPILCQSVEFVNIPPTMAALLSMRSSFARAWLDHSAADSIWAGFRGHVTFELRNNGTRPFNLRSGTRPLQLAFVRATGAPTKVYEGVYQDQRGQLHSARAVQ